MELKCTSRAAVTAEDCDADGNILPRRILQHLILSQLHRNGMEGVSKPFMREQLGMAWMVRRLKFSQLEQVHVGDVVECYTCGRTKLEITYATYCECRVSGKVVALCYMTLMPVSLAARKKVPLDEIEPYFISPPENNTELFDRLPTYNMKYPGRKTVTEAECDDNADHYASHNYADIVCAETGYWDKPGRMFKTLQIDYIREGLAGDTLKIGCTPRGAGFTVQGIHRKYVPCFNAYCEYYE